MNNPSLYKKSSSMPAQDLNEIFNEFPDLFENVWNFDGSDALLDIGSGPGDVLVDHVVPKIPIDTKVIGTDINIQMVKYASEVYKDINNLKFFQFNIENETLGKGLKANGFNFITASYVFHFVQDQRQALENIYKLLKPNGRTCLFFLAKNVIYDVYTYLSKTKKFARFMYDVESCLSPYHFEQNPLEIFESIASEIGFKTVHLNLKKKVYIYEDLARFKDHLKAINVFIPRMSEDLQNEFIDAEVEFLEYLRLIRLNEQTMEKNGLEAYELIVAILQK